MSKKILEKYKSKHILAVYSGEDAWEKLLPIRWIQANSRARVRRFYSKVDKTNSLLIIFLTPKKGVPKQIGIHFYPNKNNYVSNITKETENLWITEAPFFALELDDAPKLLKKLVSEMSN